MYDYLKINAMLNGLLDDLTSEPEYLIDESSLKIDLKGAKKENVNVTVTGNNVTIKATKKNLKGQNTKYERTFVFDEKYDPTTISAKYDESILEITAGLLESKKPRDIKID